MSKFEKYLMEKCMNDCGKLKPEFDSEKKKWVAVDQQTNKKLDFEDQMDCQDYCEQQNELNRPKKQEM